MSLDITTKLKRMTPLAPQEASAFVRAAHLILGRRYELSLVFGGDALSRRLNKMFRKKDKPTNVLAFPISDTSGEIVIDLPYAVKEAAAFEATPREHIRYLFVHGCLHLKGFDHGEKMEAAERRVMRQLERVR